MIFHFIFWSRERGGAIFTCYSTLILVKLAGQFLAIFEGRIWPSPVKMRFLIFDQIEKSDFSISEIQSQTSGRFGQNLIHDPGQMLANLVDSVFFQSWAKFGSQSPRVPDFWGSENLIRTWSGIFDFEKSNFSIFRNPGFRENSVTLGLSRQKVSLKGILFGEVGSSKPHKTQEFLGYPKNSWALWGNRGVSGFLRKNSACCGKTQFWSHAEFLAKKWAFWPWEVKIWTRK